MVLAIALIVFLCFPASSRGAELVGEPDPPQGEAVPGEEQYAVHGRDPAQGQCDALPNASEAASPGTGGPTTTAAEGDTQEAQHYDPSGTQYDPATPYPSDRGTYEDPCSAGDIEYAIEPAAEDAQSTDGALAEAHKAARRPAEAQAARPLGEPAPGSRTAGVYSGAQYDPATPYPSDVAEPVARDAQGTDAAPDETRITGSVPLAAAPVASTANQEASDDAGDEGASAPKKSLMPEISTSAPEDGPGGEGDPHAAPARVSSEGAGPRTEEPATQPEATPSLSAVPLSATGGSLLLALGVGALIYRRRFGR